MNTPIFNIEETPNLLPSVETMAATRTPDAVARAIAIETDPNLRAYWQCIQREQTRVFLSRKLETVNEARKATGKTLRKARNDGAPYQHFIDELREFDAEANALELLLEALA